MQFKPKFITVLIIGSDSVPMPDQALSPGCFFGHQEPKNYFLVKINLFKGQNTREALVGIIDNSLQ